MIRSSLNGLQKVWRVAHDQKLKFESQITSTGKATAYDIINKQHAIWIQYNHEHLSFIDILLIVLHFLTPMVMV